VNAIEPPARPYLIEEMDVEKNLLMNLVAKTMYVSGVTTPSWLADYTKLSKNIVTQLLEEMSVLRLVESKGNLGSDIKSELRYALSSKGSGWAAEAFEKSQYVGPAPVSLNSFSDQIKRQSIIHEKVDKETLANSLSGLVLPGDLVRRLGPAVNSGKSILLYGASGNGKSCIAEALGNSFKQVIYLPYCFEIDGYIINLFDEMIHKRIDPTSDESSHKNMFPNAETTDIDPRWVACKRPVVLTGGELTLEMLDLIFTPYSKYYEAPLQLKAVGGVFIVDDFGRQNAPTQAILNRWIVPLEHGRDFLTLHTGKKFPIPFDELVVFSTNLPPTNLTDEATLRRLYYKIEVPTPTPDDFGTIFNDVCREKGISLPDGLISFIFEEFYKKNNITPSGYHPKYLVEHVAAICNFHNQEVTLNKDLLRIAWKNFHVE